MSTAVLATARSLSEAREESYRERNPRRIDESRSFKDPCGIRLHALSARRGPTLEWGGCMSSTVGIARGRAVFVGEILAEIRDVHTRPRMRQKFAASPHERDPKDQRINLAIRRGSELPREPGSLHFGVG